MKYHILYLIVFFCLFWQVGTSAGTEFQNIMDIELPLSLQLKEADVKNLLSIISSLTGFEFVFDECVTGKINLELENIPLNTFFTMLLDYANWDYVQTDKTVTIFCLDEPGEGRTEQTATSSVMIPVTIQVMCLDQDGNQKILLERSDQLFLNKKYKIISSEFNPPGKYFYHRELNENGRYHDKPLPEYEMQFMLMRMVPEAIQCKATYSVTHSQTQTKLITTQTGSQEVVCPLGQEKEIVTLPWSSGGKITCTLKIQ